MSINNTFGPMNRSNRDYFLIISVLGPLAMIMSLVYGIVNYGKNKSILLILLSVFQPFILYFQNRLLYNMCVGSI